MTTTYISLHNIKILEVSEKKTTDGELGPVTWREIVLIDKDGNRVDISAHLTDDFEIKVWYRSMDLGEEIV